jgi:hypothetical protein
MKVAQLALFFLAPVDSTLSLGPCVCEHRSCQSYELFVFHRRTLSTITVVGVVIRPGFFPSPSGPLGREGAGMAAIALLTLSSAFLVPLIAAQ